VNWADAVAFLRQGRELSWPERWQAVLVACEPPVRRRRRLARATGPGARLVFVCYGNIMRSAFAEAWARRVRPELAARVSSAGTNARTGREAEPTAQAVATQFGVALDAHRATALTERAIGDDDVVVCMDWLNVARARVQLPSSAHARVFLVGDVAKARRVLPDPYGHGAARTHVAFAWLRETVEAWVQKITASP